LKVKVKGYKVDLTTTNNKLDTLVTENTALKKLVSDWEEEIAALKLKLNNLEQHNRALECACLGTPPHSS
jgi:predicted  nucleic acid-binding Zn-ribbon protein